MPSISRRRLLQGSAAAVGALALGGCDSGSSAPSEPTRPVTTPPTSTPPSRDKRPNIILILADDMGYADLGCWGSEIATPNLDRLAAQGVRFTGMHNNARCSVTRASLLTGLYPTQTGVGYNTANLGIPAYQGYLNDSCVTLAEGLQLAGYRTAIAGKWHVSSWHAQQRALPAQRGFERSLCAVGGESGSAGYYYDTVRYLNGQIIGRSKDPNYYFTNSITGYCISSIKEFAASKDPFFIYAAYTSPHFPLQAPADAIAKYSGHYATGWDAVRQQRYQRGLDAGVIDSRWTLPPPGPGTRPYGDVGHHDWQQRRMEVYAAQLSIMDEGIGRIMSTLDQQGLTDNTLVLFLSDNGGCAEAVTVDNRHEGAKTREGQPLEVGNRPGIMPGPENTFQSYGINWANVSNTPFRRYKRWVEEGGTSTPLVASWPGTLPAGGLDHRLLHVMDFMPTFLDLAGADYPKTYRGHAITPTEGQSFAPVLTDAAGSADWSRTGTLFWEHLGHRAVRLGDWKIVADQPVGGWELFDMVNDRTETTDLSTQHPEVLASLSSAYDAWKARVGVRTWHRKRGYRPA